MKIRIKVKYLIGIIFSCVILITVLIFARGYILFGIVKTFDIFGLSDNTDIYMGKLAEGGFGKASMLSEKARVENILKKEDIKYTHYLQISSSLLVDGKTIGYKTINTVNNRYKRFDTGLYEGKSFSEYTMGVAIVNWFGGNVEFAVSLMESIKFNNNSELDQLWGINLANMYLALGDAEKAKKLIEPYIEREDNFKFYRYTLMMRYYLIIGALEDAEKYSSKDMYSEKYISDQAVNSVYANPLKFDGSIEESLLDILKSSGNYKSKNRIYGRILEDGRPMKNVFVFLKDIRHMNGSSSIPGKHDGLYFMGISNENGYYEINNIADGIYGIMIYMPYQRIIAKNIVFNKEYSLNFTGHEEYKEDIKVTRPFDIKIKENEQEGTITFSWDDSNQNVEYYLLNISEILNVEDLQTISNNRFQSHEIYGNTYTLDIKNERLNSYKAGISLSSDGVDPIQYIEPLYHKGKYSYIIYGYGNREYDGMTYSNKGIYPNKELNIIEIEGNEWTKEDRLLLDKKWEDAIKGYEYILSENPFDIHALKVLSRLYNFGYNVIKDETGYIELTGKDTEKSLELLQRLDRLIESENVKNVLASIYVDIGEYEKSLEIYENLMNKNPSPFYNYSVSRIYLYNNDYSNALKYLMNFFEQTGRGAENIIILGLLYDNMQLAEEAAEKYDNKSYLADYISIIEKYKRIDRKAYDEFFDLVNDNKIEEAEKWIENKNDCLAYFYMGIMQLNKNIIYKEKEIIYKGYHTKVDNNILYELMKYLGKGKLNSGYDIPDK